MRSLLLMGLRVLGERKVPADLDRSAAERPEVGKGDSASPAACNVQHFRSWQNM